MTACGYKQTSSLPKLRSALPPKADIADGSHQSLLVTQSGHSEWMDSPSAAAEYFPPKALLSGSAAKEPIWNG